MNPPSPHEHLAGLRVVHAANYQFAKDGSMFYNCDIKLNQGLIQSGCLVYPFSINDRARMFSWAGNKGFGLKSASRALIKTCRNTAPDVLLLGHAQSVSRETLLAIRNEIPDIRIGLWYIDPMWVPKDVQHLHDRADMLDAICATTAGELLRPFARDNCPVAFIPNPVEAGIERYRAFDNASPDYDAIFIGSDKRAPERRQFLIDLRDRLSASPEVRFGLFGCLGNRSVFGHEKERLLTQSRMALNLSRRSDVELYSSDRIAQISGNGQVVLTAAGNGFEQLFSSDEAVFYSDVDDLAARIIRLKADDAEAVRIARNGWKKAHSAYSARSVAEFILGLTLRHESYQSAPWAEHVYYPTDHDTRDCSQAA